MSNQNKNVNHYNTQKSKKLIECVTEKLRIKHYSIRTEKAYLKWIIRYILFHNKRHPKNNRIEIWLVQHLLSLI